MDLKLPEAKITTLGAARQKVSGIKAEIKSVTKQQAESFQEEQSLLATGDVDNVALVSKLAMVRAKLDLFPARLKKLGIELAAALDELRLANQSFVNLFANHKSETHEVVTKRVSAFIRAEVKEVQRHDELIQQIVPLTKEMLDAESLCYAFNFIDGASIMSGDPATRIVSAADRILSLAARLKA